MKKCQNSIQISVYRQDPARGHSLQNLQNKTPMSSWWRCSSTGIPASCTSLICICNASHLQSPSACQGKNRKNNRLVHNKVEPTFVFSRSLARTAIVKKPRQHEGISTMNSLFSVILECCLLKQWFPIGGARTPWGCEKRLLGVREELANFTADKRYC